MGNFCTRCGKPLEEGKEHVCENVVAVTSTSSSSSSNANDYLNSYIKILKGIFTKPADTIKENTSESNFVLSVIALVLNSVVTGLFVYLLIKESMASLGMLGSLIGLGSYGLSNIEVPFMKVFMYGFVFIAVWFVVCAAMIFLIANVFMKDKITFKESLSLVGNVSVFTTLTTIVSIICIYISMKLMLVVLLLAAVFYLTYLYQGISDKTELDKNKLGYVFVPSIAVAIFVIVYVLPKILF